MDLFVVILGSQKSSKKTSKFKNSLTIASETVKPGWRWYALHGDERESVKHAKQGSSAQEKP